MIERLAFPRDPDFPQLRVASDPHQMLELFRGRLTPVAGRRYEIQGCEPFRFRVRQSTPRCVLQYTLRLAEPATGRRWDQWVTGVVYAEPGAAERRWRELGAADPRREIPEPWLTFEPVSFIPELQMLVEVFPFDPKLPQLGRVMNGALQGVEPLLLAGLGEGRWTTETRAIEPTRYRTELGAALKYTLQARPSDGAKRRTIRYYLKVYRDEHGKATFDLLQALAARAAPYTAVRAVAYVPEVRTLVLEEAAGTPLQAILRRRDAAAAAAAVRAVARAVAAFNQDTLPLAHSHALADQLDDVQGAAQLLGWACPARAPDVASLADAVTRGLAAAPPVPIHRDLKTDHIFLAGDRVIFIDLDSVVLGDPVRDPAHLYAHIAARVGLDSMPLDEARRTAALFAEEYFNHVPPPWGQSFPLHCAGALLEVARGIFKRQEPEWPRKVGAAIAEAHRAVAGWR